MPAVTAEVVVPVSPDVAYAVSQTTGATRLRWDLFIRHQHRRIDAFAAACSDPVVLDAIAADTTPTPDRP